MSICVAFIVGMVVGIAAMAIDEYQSTTKVKEEIDMVHNLNKLTAEELICVSEKFIEEVNKRIWNDLPKFVSIPNTKSQTIDEIFEHLSEN